MQTGAGGTVTTRRPPAAYRLQRPVLRDLRESLRAALGEPRADDVLGAAAADAGVSLHDDLSVPDLLRLARGVSSQRGPVSVLGLSAEIRCETWLTLAGRAAS